MDIGQIAIDSLEWLTYLKNVCQNGRYNLNDVYGFYLKEFNAELNKREIRLGMGKPLYILTQTDIGFYADIMHDCMDKAKSSTEEKYELK